MGNNIPSFMSQKTKANYGYENSRSKTNSGKRSGHNPRFELEADMDRACARRDEAIDTAANALAKYAMAMNSNGDSIKTYDFKNNSFDVLVSFSDEDKVNILSKVIVKLVDNL